MTTLWFDADDVYKLKPRAESLSSFKTRVYRTVPANVRRAQLSEGGPGRPKLRLFIDADGLAKLGVPMGQMRPCRIPIRLTDSARKFCVEPGVFCFKGKILSSQDMIVKAVSEGLHDLIEPDFLPL